MGIIMNPENTNCNEEMAGVLQAIEQLETDEAIKTVEAFKAGEAAEIDEAIKAVEAAEAAEAAEKIKTGKNRNFAVLPLCTLLFLLVAIYYSNCVGHTLGQLLLKVDSFGHFLLIGRRK